MSEVIEKISKTMECNKDEAARAKDVAEKKFEAKDYIGAKKFATKAQSLYQDLDGIQHLLTTLGVYISSQNRVGDESDHYKVLDVSPIADEETIRRQYRKLALVLHPDKNKSIGAEGAFNLVAQALSALMDPTKRWNFDHKRNNLAPKVPSPTATPKTPAETGKASSNRKRRAPKTPSFPSTFWTVCIRCNLCHEYPREYLRRNILCTVCNKPFYTVEYSVPYRPSPEMPFLSTPIQQKVAESWNPSSKTSGVPGDQTSAAAQNIREKNKRKRNDAVDENKEEKEIGSKRKSASKKEAGPSSDANAGKKRKVVEDPTNKGSKIKPKSRELPNAEILKMLVTKAQLEIREKLKVLKNAKEMASSADRTKKTVTGTENGKEKESRKDSQVKSITVPDSDFHDFDMDRTETCFAENQVWATYDDDDSMPRYYAIIQKVISRKPFKVRISWLSSKSNSELGPLNWVASGFIKTCGEFRTGKKVTNESLNSFSHKVRWTKSEEGLVMVFPKKGDVWALYRNWSANWNELTEDKVIHEYDMVEVVGDYDGELGVMVSLLTKVAGFKTVFRRHRDEKETKIVPKEEIFRFSHQVPSVLLSGKEGDNTLKGCRELDPAAIPPELLRVISGDSNENMIADEGEK